LLKSDVECGNGFYGRVVRSFARLTAPLRNRITQTITPNVWSKGTQDYISGVPRPSTKYAKRVFGSAEIAVAEIGVAEGINAESILEMLNVKKMFLVDPYEPYFTDARIGDGVTPRGIETKFVDINAKVLVAERLARFKSKIEFVPLYSTEAVHVIPKVDFAYIDANHDFPHVTEDIENYWPKIKPGGILSGHDFEQNYPGVTKAVVNFAVHNDLQLFTEHVDWWFKK